MTDRARTYTTTLLPRPAVGGGRSPTREPCSRQQSPCCGPRGLQPAAPRKSSNSQKRLAGRATSTFPEGKDRLVLEAVVRAAAGTLSRLEASFGDDQVSLAEPVRTVFQAIERELLAEDSQRHGTAPIAAQQPGRGETSSSCVKATRDVVLLRRRTGVGVLFRAGPGARHR